jgi:LacI family transcriptional regulator
LATVDRALHGRAHVSAQTARRVQAAIVELTRQEGQLAARGRRMFIDIVVEAPRRFSDELRRATAQVLPQFTPAVIRPRFHFAEDIGPGKTVAFLSKIAKRGSQGIVLKAQNVAPIRAEIDRLLDLKIPVVTVFTDCPDCARLAYVGLNNANAGRTGGISLCATAARPQRFSFDHDIAPAVSRRRGTGAGLCGGNGPAVPAGKSA